jgi:hypothetical protein
MQVARPSTRHAHAGRSLDDRRKELSIRRSTSPPQVGSGLVTRGPRARPPSSDFRGSPLSTKRSRSWLRSLAQVQMGCKRGVRAVASRRGVDRKPRLDVTSRPPRQYRLRFLKRWPQVRLLPGAPLHAVWGAGPERKDHRSWRAARANQVPSHDRCPRSAVGVGVLQASRSGSLRRRHSCSAAPPSSLSEPGRGVRRLSGARGARHRRGRGLRVRRRDRDARSHAHDPALAFQEGRRLRRASPASSSTRSSSTARCSSPAPRAACTPRSKPSATPASSPTVP